MTQLRRLNEAGIARFLEFLHGVKAAPSLAPPIEILSHPTTSADLGDIEIEIERRVFGSRFAAAKYLFELFEGSGLTQVEQDRGLWTWLSLFYFEELCPPGKKGQRKPGEDARWIPEGSKAFRYYRHLLAGPFRIYRAHKEAPESAAIVLCGALDQPGEIVAQLASRQEIVTNRSLLTAATSLYLNQETGRPKRGVTNKDPTTKPARGQPGTVLRFVDIFKQFDVVWDLYTMNPDSILEMLPKEFDRYRFEKQRAV